MGVGSVGPNQNRVNPTPSPTPAESGTPSSATTPSSTRAQAKEPRDTFEASSPTSTPGASATPTTDQKTEATETGSQVGADVTAASSARDPADTAQRNGVPWISQLAPEGVSESYSNGDFNCAPASFAMVARKAGFGEGLTDADLISELARTGKTERITGTSMNGALAMANKIGMPVDRSEVSFPGFNQAWMDEQLDKGKSVIANGALQTPEGPSGHFIVVTGRDAEGNYQINDPLNADNVSLTTEQLGEFLARNPLHKGASVAIG